MKIADEHPAALVALELGALAEHDAQAAQARRDNLTNDARDRVVDAVRAQHELHRARLSRALDELAVDAALLSIAPILTAAPREAENAQRRALGALSVREGLHRLEACASLLGAPPVAELVESRNKLDVRLREQLAGWGSIAPWRARFATDLRLDDALSAKRWWMTAWPVDESLASDSDTDLDAVTAWIGERLSSGRLVLTRDEATALLSSESGRRLAADLADRLDLASLEDASPEISAAATDQRHDISPKLRTLTNALASIPATRAAGDRLAAATAGDVPIAKGFAAIARFHATAATFVHGLGIVATGSISRSGSGSDICSAALVIPEGSVQSLGIGDLPQIERAEWTSGGVAWAVDPPASIGFKIRDGETDGVVEVTLADDSRIDDLVIVLRAIAAASLAEVLELLSSLDRSGDDDLRQGSRLLRGVLTPLSP